MDGPRDGVPAGMALTPDLASEIRHAIVDARVAAEQRAAFVPLRDLADAMRANAEALRSVQETQERIARSVDRSDRTEAVVQSTKALNETFRGVRAAQDALVGRLEREQKRPLRAALLAGGLVLAAAAVVAGFFLMREDTLEQRIENLGRNLGTADREAWETSRREAEKELLDRLETLSQKSSMSEADRVQREAEIAEMRGRLETLRREKDAVEADRDDARRLAREVSTLRSDVGRLRTELDAARTGREGRERLLAEKDAEIARLKASLAGVPRGVVGAGDGASLPDRNAAEAGADEDAGASTAAGPPLAADAEAVAAKPRGLSATAVQDPGQVRKLLDAINLLLNGVEGRESWQVAAAVAVDGATLVDAVLEARAADGRLLRRFDAAQCRFLLDVRGRSLEIRMSEGHVSFLGQRKVKFLEGRYSAFLGVDPAPFRNAANPLVTER